MAVRPREGKGREGKGREGKGREGKGGHLSQPPLHQHDIYVSELCRPLCVGLSLDIRQRDQRVTQSAHCAAPIYGCHAAPPTAVGGAHNSPIASHQNNQVWLSHRLGKTGEDYGEFII